MSLELPISFSKVVKSESRSAGLVRDKLLAYLCDLGYSQEDIFAVHLALEEAIANGIIHGNKNDSSKKLEISYSLSSEGVDISIVDEGCGFVPAQVPDPRDNGNILKPSGRGMLLMRHYMDLVEYKDGGRCLHMFKRLRID